MAYCKSIKFCFYFGFAAMIAHSVLASALMLLAFAIEYMTIPIFMDQVIAHDMFKALCIFFLFSWIVSPLALCCFKKAIHITHDCSKEGCEKAA